MVRGLRWQVLRESDQNTLAHDELLCLQEARPWDRWCTAAGGGGRVEDLSKHTWPLHSGRLFSFPAAMNYFISKEEVLGLRIALWLLNSRWGGPWQGNGYSLSTWYVLNPMPSSGRRCPGAKTQFFFSQKAFNLSWKHDLFLWKD